MRGRWLALAVGYAAACAPAHAATTRMFSYDPGDAETRAAAGPMTFQFQQGLFGSRFIALRSTEADATVELSPASEAVLGRSLKSVTGADAEDRRLYQIKAADEGDALVAALCPGSKRGWLAIGKPVYGQDLRVAVIGDTPAVTPRLCRNLQFTFRGEWRLPNDGKFDTRAPPERRGPR